MRFVIVTGMSGGGKRTALKMLEDAGLGASLQHYNPLIDDTVHAEWKLNPKWELVAQMPFGAPTKSPGPKEIGPIKQKVLIFK